MRVFTRLRPPTAMRLAFWLATTSLAVGTVLPALAQPAPPPGAELAGQENSDPPAIAGSLAALSGSVSFHAAGETNWSAATLNYPVTNGAGFWTEANASATIDIADDKLVMDGSTEFDVVSLDQTQFSATLAQGAVFIELNSVGQGQTLSVNTPRGTVTIGQAGRYEIVAGDTNDATLVTVVSGAAHISATGMDLDVGPRQTASIGGTDNFQGTVDSMQQDSFLQEQLRAGTALRAAGPVPRQVQYMTGGAALASYGSFSQTQQYGQVWYPRDVASDWAPYRDGHWAYVQPWGWTWVDNARWGFAPFHYGRWVQVQNRWGWVAGGGGDAGYGEGGGGNQYPVYSPALVSFVGVGAGLGLGLAIGAGDYAPAWVPLGPREPYYPWYHVRNDYFERMNRPYGVPRDIIDRGPRYDDNVHNTTIINNTNIRQTFINQRAATVIPAAAFARGEGVARAGRPLPAQAFANSRPLVGRLPVRPTAFTPNLSPVAARRFNVAVPERPVGRVTAGPRIVERPPGMRAAPELRRASLPPNIRAVPADQVRPQPNAGPGRPGMPNPGRPDAVARPGMPGLRQNPGQPGASPQAQRGLPPLRGPGTRPETAPARPGAERAGPGPRGPAVTQQPGPQQPGLRAPGAPGRPELRAPGAVPAGREARPGEIARPNAPIPPVAPRVEGPRAAGRPEQRAVTPGAPRPETPRAEMPRAMPRNEAPQPAPRVEAPRAAPRMEAPRPQPRPEAPRPNAPRPEAPRPAPRVEAPRAAPRMEAPRQPRPEAPRPEAPRPAPRMEAPRPQPRPEAPRPPPRVEAPRPAPQAPRPEPRMEAPRPPPRAEAPHPQAHAGPPAPPDKHPH